MIFLIAGWRIFSRAGRPGWAVLIPLYNLYVYTQIIKRPRWWMLLYFSVLIPFAGPLVALLLSLLDSMRLAKAFGKSNGFGVGLALLGPIFLPMLAFGNAKYDGTTLNEKHLQ